MEASTIINILHLVSMLAYQDVLKNGIIINKKLVFNGLILCFVKKLQSLEVSSFLSLVLFSIIDTHVLHIYERLLALT